MSRITSASPKKAKSSGFTFFNGETSLPVQDWSELEQAIRALADGESGTNAIVTLTAETGDALSFGVAGPRDADNPGLNTQLACLNLVPATGDPPYWAAVGDPNLAPGEGEVVVFKFNGHWTEIPRRNCVSVESMVRAVEEFFSGLPLPRSVSWEEI